MSDANVHEDKSPSRNRQTRLGRTVRRLRLSQKIGLALGVVVLVITSILTYVTIKK
jgi:hypothetical protein